MKKLIVLLLLLSAAAVGQVTTACTTTGYCGNTQTSPGSFSTSNNGFALGIPFSINASYTLSDLKVWLSGTGTAHLVAYIVCDSNLSGTTIAAASPCPANNVVCSVASQVPGANGTFTATFSGCNLTLTTVRYWMFTNTDNATLGYGIGASGKTAYAIATTCCTVPAAITGTASADALDEFGIDLTPAGGTPPNIGFKGMVGFKGKIGLK